MISAATTRTDNMTSISCNLCLKNSEINDYEELPENWRVETLNQQGSRTNALYQLVACGEHTKEEFREKKQKIKEHWQKLKETKLTWEEDN